MDVGCTLETGIRFIISSFYFVHAFRHKTASNASDVLNRTYQAQGALTVAHKNKNKITIKDYAMPISTINI